ncbi:hypothetical protein R1flu_026280 [Riccia fluitans]|uniref:Uncharacterized protein n=1 Tax=Riccia fluitans TaxID=41844 RepID=A0ABD1XFI0_9MARC
MLHTHFCTSPMQYASATQTIFFLRELLHRGHEDEGVTGCGERVSTAVNDGNWEVVTAVQNIPSLFVELAGISYGCTVFSPPEGKMVRCCKDTDEMRISGQPARSLNLLLLFQG